MRISTRLRLRLWFALALVVVLTVVTWLWLRGTWLSGGYSPLPVPRFGESPLVTPVSSAGALSSRGGAILLWVALGIVLALLIALVIVYWPSRT